MKRSFTILFLLSWVWVLPAQTLELEADKDNTLYEDADRVLSNGSGSHFYVGRLRTGELRRGLLHFPIEENVPSGAVIESVSLKLNLSLSPNVSPDHSLTLHRMLTDWGEGASDAGDPGGGGITFAAAETGDATWSHRFFPDSLWTTEGGDFSPDTSAFIMVPPARGLAISFSDSRMAEDVQAWLNGDVPNYGWMLIGDETTNQTARRYDSREIADSTLRPLLVIEYSTGVPLEAEVALEALELFPNPVRDQLSVRFQVQQSMPVSIQLFNLIGKRLLIEQIDRAHGTVSRTLNMGAYPSGVYLLRLETPGGVVIRRLNKS